MTSGNVSFSEVELMLTGVNSERCPFTGEPVVRRSNRSENSELPECLFNRRDLFGRAWILFGSGPRRYETKLLFAVQKPRTLGHETVLARDPFLALLVGGALTGWLVIAEMAWRAFTSWIVIAGAHSALRAD
jgi:hypothetical protein